MDRLYVMDYPQGTPRRLTRNNTVEAQPVLSPDGRLIAYVTWDDSGGHVYRVRWDVEGEPERLTRTVALYRQPAWSPDGTRIVVVRDSAQAFRDYAGSRISNARAELAWIPAAGGEATLIGPTDGRPRPHFTANSHRIYKICKNLWHFKQRLLGHVRNPSAFQHMPSASILAHTH